MKKAVILILLFALTGLLPFITFRTTAIGIWGPPVADFPMKFDNFGIGTTQPFPFKLITHGGGSAGKVSGFIFTPWSSPPNVYQMTTGAARQNVSIQAKFNSTGYRVTATIQSTCYNIAGNTVIFNLSSSMQVNSTTFVLGSGGCVGPGASKQYNATVYTTPGTIVNFALNWTANAPAGNNANLFFDNFNISSGAVIVPNYNFQLLNSSSPGPNWFDISNYPGSQLILNYTTSTNSSANWANATPQGLQFPDVNYTNLSLGKLITLYVGNTYSRSLIPAPETKLNMYVDNPASVLAYRVCVQAPPNFYGLNSKIFIQAGGHNITSGYLDSTSSYFTYVVPGTYTVIVNDGVHTTNQIINFPSVFPQTGCSVSVYGYAITVGATANGQAQTRWIAGWNSTQTGIVLNYWDNLSSTLKLGLQIKLENLTGTFTLFSHFYTVGTPAFSVTVPANTPPLFKNNTNLLYVFVTINSTFFGGNFSLGSQPLFTCPGCYFQSTPNLPTSIGGLNSIFPNFTWQNGFAILIIVFTAGGFGLFQAKIGAIITPFVAGFLTLGGFLALNATFITTIAALSILGALSWWRRQP